MSQKRSHDLIPPALSLSNERQHLLIPRCITMLLLTAFFCYSPAWATHVQRSAYATTPQVQEYELKAVYLYNFLQFVSWPKEHASLPKDGVKVIGILGDSPFGESLEALQSNVHNKGMSPVRVIHYGHYREGLNLGGCNLLFVCKSEKRNFQRIIAGLKGAPVLTVADTEDFFLSGGMISLVNRSGKIRWMINRQAIDKAGLQISAQILNMAVTVRE